VTAMILGGASAGAGQLRSHMIAGARLSRCSSARAAKHKDWRRAASSTSSKSKLAIDWHGKSVSISRTISF